MKRKKIDFRHLDADHEVIGDGLHLDVHQPVQPMTSRHDAMPHKRRPSQQAWRKVRKVVRRYKDGLTDGES